MAERRPIQERAAFDFIRYGSVWEDADILCQALGHGSRGQRLLSIASAGDNSLALLTLDPKEVIAADLNPAQLACLELRVAAFQALSYPALLAFFGVTPDADRLKAYEALRPRLSAGAQAFWDGQAPALAAGIIHAGKLERFLKRYQWFLKRFVHGPRSWRLLNRVAFSKPVMGLWGRDPQFFKHASQDVTSGPNQRLDQVMARASAPANPYLRYHLSGNYTAQALPLYLRREHYATIRRRSQRIRLYLGPVEQAAGTFYGFNLSNIFEYMDAQQHERTYTSLIDKARPGGRLAYWNLHVKRRRPDSAKARVLTLDKMSKALHARDQNWAYRSFHVDQLRAQRNQSF